MGLHHGKSHQTTAHANGCPPKPAMLAMAMQKGWGRGVGGGGVPALGVGLLALHAPRNTKTFWVFWAGFGPKLCAFRTAFRGGPRRAQCGARNWSHSSYPVRAGQHAASQHGKHKHGGPANRPGTNSVFQAHSATPIDANSHQAKPNTNRWLSQAREGFSTYYLHLLACYAVGGYLHTICVCPSAKVNASAHYLYLFGLCNVPV